jgi:hypothetical protein
VPICGIMAKSSKTYGRDRTGDERPAELARWEKQMQKPEQAKRVLKERARELAKMRCLTYITVKLHRVCYG